MIKYLKNLLKGGNFKKLIYKVWSKNRKIPPFDPTMTKYIPLGAVGSVFGKNPATQVFQYIKTGMKGSPTHTMIYVGAGDHTIAEADLVFTFNRLEKYVGKKVVFHYFRRLTTDQRMELKNRIYFLVKNKIIYDGGGYLDFIGREIEKLGFDVPDILQEKDENMFCSEAIQTIYSGDLSIKTKTSPSSVFGKWSKIKKISKEQDPSHTTPADIYLYMEELYKKYPAQIGRVELNP